MKLLILLVTSLLIGCTENVSEEAEYTFASVPPTSTEPMWESQHPDGDDWTTHVHQQLSVIGTNLLSVVPADYPAFCPKYKSLSTSDKKIFWTFLMAQMVRYESNFDPDEYYTESFTDSNGDKIVSRGLLMLSFESANAYGCNFQTQNELHDPEKNLSCGIRILDRWLSRDKRIAGKIDGQWRGGARYWSVLRSSSDKYLKIVNATRAISICNTNSN
ncbi:transglycosylase SLT domain-containing protein [Bdellovibrio reynosensis]|uniref:Transglycosylase SLT domain-containing protein n=1 Tax=Bdellovibrio reynosensis TaxID=2835041 RepID=A0ABY4CDD8_9BACT|nr:transglycosylase SLT domain-containing protein [Bdellovibrio reynosensis]UOF01543.1 transglycosylase SLT domain-containing protein [Bdellovibrio reynosensis]